MAEVLNLRHKMPFNANEQDSPAIDTIKKTMTFVIVFFIWRLVRALIRFSGFSGFADGRSERSKTSPVSEQIEPTVAKLLRQNSESVKQIQEKSRHRHFLLICFMFS